MVFDQIGHVLIKDGSATLRTAQPIKITKQPLRKLQLRGLGVKTGCETYVLLCWHKTIWTMRG